MTTDKDDAPTTPAKPRRKAWLIVGGTVTAVILLFAVVFAGVLIWAASTPRESASHAETYESVTGVEMDMTVGDLELIGDEGTDLSVERETDWKGPEPHITEELNAEGVFEAGMRCGDSYIFWMVDTQCHIDYTATMPADAPATVRMTTADIDIDGLGGDLDVEATTGDIDARNLRTTSTSIELTTGDVTVAFDEVLGDVDISTVTGDVTVIVPDDGTTYEVRHESTTGEKDIGIATDPSVEAARVINVTMTTGNLEVRYAP